MKNRVGSNLTEGPERVEMDPTALLGPRSLGDGDEEPVVAARAWTEALIEACLRRRDEALRGPLTDA
jgi:hypothetical protein